MCARFSYLEGLQSTLSRLQKDPRTRRRIPKDIWSSIKNFFAFLKTF